MPTKCVVYPSYAIRHPGFMFTKAELLAELEQRGVSNVAIERALGLPSSRVTEIRRATPGRTIEGGKPIRDLSYDEGVKLIQAFGLEPAEAQAPVPRQILRLVVRYIAGQLGANPEEGQLEELTQDVRAFAEFAADPKVRRSVEAADGFFQALRRRRPEPEPASRPETDPLRLR